jgi:hypothetical protein
MYKHICDCHWKRMVSKVWTQNKTFYCHYNALSPFAKSMKRCSTCTKNNINFLFPLLIGYLVFVMASIAGPTELHTASPCCYHVGREGGGWWHAIIHKNPFYFTPKCRVCILNHLVMGNCFSKQWIGTGPSLFREFGRHSSKLSIANYIEVTPLDYI